MEWQGRRERKTSLVGLAFHPHASYGALKKNDSLESQHSSWLSADGLEVMNKGAHLLTASYAVAAYVRRTLTFYYLPELTSPWVIVFMFEQF